MGSWADEMRRRDEEESRRRQEQELATQMLEEQGVGSVRPQGESGFQSFSNIIQSIGSWLGERGWGGTVPIPQEQRQGYVPPGSPTPPTPGPVNQAPVPRYPVVGQNPSQGGAQLPQDIGDPNYAVNKLYSDFFKPTPPGGQMKLEQRAPDGGKVTTVKKGVSIEQPKQPGQPVQPSIGQSQQPPISPDQFGLQTHRAEQERLANLPHAPLLNKGTEGFILSPKQKYDQKMAELKENLSNLNRLSEERYPSFEKAAYTAYQDIKKTPWIHRVLWNMTEGFGATDRRARSLMAYDQAYRENKYGTAVNLEEKRYRIANDVFDKAEADSEVEYARVAKELDDQYELNPRKRGNREFAIEYTMSKMRYSRARAEQYVDSLYDPSTKEYRLAPTSAERKLFNMRNTANYFLKLDPEMSQRTALALTSNPEKLVDWFSNTAFRVQQAAENETNPAKRQALFDEALLLRNQQAGWGGDKNYRNMLFIRQVKSDPNFKTYSKEFQDFVNRKEEDAKFSFMNTPFAETEAGEKLDVDTRLEDLASKIEQRKHITASTKALTTKDTIIPKHVPLLDQFVLKVRPARGAQIQHKTQAASEEITQIKESAEADLNQLSVLDQEWSKNPETYLKSIEKYKKSNPDNRNFVSRIEAYREQLFENFTPQQRADIQNIGYEEFGPMAKRISSRYYTTLDEHGLPNTDRIYAEETERLLKERERKAELKARIKQDEERKKRSKRKGF